MTKFAKMARLPTKFTQALCRARGGGGIVQVSPVSFHLVFVNNATELDAIRLALAHQCMVLSKFRIQVPKKLMMSNQIERNKNVVTD